MQHTQSIIFQSCIANAIRESPLAPPLTGHLWLIYQSNYVSGLMFSKLIWQLVWWKRTESLEKPYGNYQNYLRITTIFLHSSSLWYSLHLSTNELDEWRATLFSSLNSHLCNFNVEKKCYNRIRCEPVVCISTALGILQNFTANNVKMIFVTLTYVNLVTKS